MEILRPTWAEISLDRFKNNLKKIKKIIPSKTKLLLVVKANAYGHGAVELAKYAEENFLVDCFGVTSIEEGIRLRENQIRLPVIILGSIYPPKNFPYLFKYLLTPTVSSLLLLKELERYTRSRNQRIKIHIKLETGMNRIGVWPETAKKMIDYITVSKNIILEGIYSHFSSADTDRLYTKQQLKRFLDFVKDYRHLNIIKHIANSYAMLNYPDSHLDMVRCGIAGYGYLNGFDEIMTLKTRIVFIKTVKKGEFISYSKSYRTSRRSRIATIPVGYGDGYLRCLSNKAYVRIKNSYAPVVGNITMDMTMIDVTGLDVDVGDEVTVMGGGIERISIIETAKKANTIPYEITTLITERVKRVYK